MGLTGRLFDCCWLTEKGIDWVWLVAFDGKRLVDVGSNEANGSNKSEDGDWGDVGQRGGWVL